MNELPKCVYIKEAPQNHYTFGLKWDFQCFSERLEYLEKKWIYSVFILQILDEINLNSQGLARWPKKDIHSVSH